eukprot:TRINITY_DN9221_c0_g3_i1.p1 TRINITY_DN9221_c0_g3~~TRINITY_DN9221_c0_g3_i1.p1  ORF type:complete len:528 (-),score=129.24 TRINITY_DN9221_c0_g3_i1:192-1661(-)
MAQRILKPFARRALLLHLALGFGVLLLGLGRQYLQMQRGLQATSALRRQGNQVAELRQLLLTGRSARSAPPLTAEADLKVAQAEVKTQMNAKGWGRRSTTLEELPPAQQPEENSWFGQALMLCGLGSILTAGFFLTSPSYRTGEMAAIPTPRAEVLRDQSLQLKEAARGALQAVGKTTSKQSSESFARLEKALSVAEAQAEGKAMEMKPRVVEFRDTMHQMDHNLHTAAAEAGKAAQAMRHTLATGKQQVVENMNATTPQIHKALKEAYMAAKSNLEQSQQGLVAACSEADAALQKSVADVLPKAVPAIHMAAANVERGIDAITSAGAHILDKAASASEGFDQAVQSRITKIPNKTVSTNLTSSMRDAKQSFTKQTAGLQQGIKQNRAAAVATVRSLDSTVTPSGIRSTSPTLTHAVEVAAAGAAVVAARDASTSGRKFGNRARSPVYKPRPLRPVYSLRPSTSPTNQVPQYVRAQQNQQVRSLLLNTA